jgi:hypothetical protein
MKKSTNTNQKLKLSRQTLRQLEAGQLAPAAGGTNVTWPPCHPSRQADCGVG